MAEKEKQTLEPQDHPIIRNEEACFESSFKAIQYAKKYNSRLHILHISTAKELQLFTNLLPLKDKRITAEVCVHHLHFTSDDYALLGNLIKCNPAIKAPRNKAALWQALLDDRLDVIATDHAPHTWHEKNEPYEKSARWFAAGSTFVATNAAICAGRKITIEKMVEKMSHAVADCFAVNDRGYLREGYFADVVLVDMNKPYIVLAENILYKCGWSPLQSAVFPATITHTFVNGNLVFESGVFNETATGMRLQFDR